MKYLLTLLLLIPSIAFADFAQCHKWASPGSGLHQMAQVWNPVNSGKVLKVSRITMHSNINNAWNIIATNTQFSELRNPGHSTHINSSGVTAATGELRGGIHANQGQYQVYSLYVLSAPAYSQVAYDVNVTVDPGWGFAIVSRNENDAMAACFDWTEE
jgi:predicted S18 family serine protease